MRKQDLKEMNRLFGLAAYLVFWFSMPALSAPVDRYVLPDCEETPAVKTSNYPGFGSIHPNNKLVLPAGKTVLATEKPVMVYGRLLDQHCVPISNAKIELWHTDEAGRHRFATKAALASAEPVFTGAGRATSDNLGQFHFMTLYPGEYRYTVTREDKSRYSVFRAPHFNVQIEHEKLRDFRTNLFFEQEPENSEDFRFKRLSSSAQARVLMRTEPRRDGGLQSFVDIVLPQAQPFRKY